MTDRKLAVLRRINEFAEEFDPYGYQDDLDFEITDEYLLENWDSVVEFIRRLVENDDMYDFDDYEKETIEDIIADLHKYNMWERKVS